MAYAKQLGQKLPSNSIVCLFGDLGAGKTTFVKGLAEGVGFNAEQVCSPTFVFLNIYPGNKLIYHFDLYRLSDADEFLSMGYDEFLAGGEICCIEWSERIQTILPPSSLCVEMQVLGENAREITIK